MAQEAITVRDKMRKKFCSFHTQDNIFDAVEKMQKFDVSGGPVISDSGEIIGFLSEQDCIQQLLKASYHCEMTATVTDLMQTEVLTVTPEMNIIDLALKLTVRKPKLYPVVSGNKVVGVISRREVIATMLEVGRECHLLQSA